MEVALQRLHKFAGILNHKHCKIWHTQQSELSSISRRKYFHISLGKMWDNQPQQAMNFSSNKTKMTVARKNPRKWFMASNNLDSEGKQIKVVSYNILAQDLLVKHMELYTQCNPMYLRWSYRLPRLTQEILGHKPDIVCLQEVQEDHLNDIAANLKSELPMNFVYKKKTGIANDGCAIFFNKDVFDLVDSDAVEYYQPNCQRLDRHNIAVIAKLRCKSNPDYLLLVCTTHLLYNPRRQDVRLAQLMVLLAELDRHVVRFEQKTGEKRKLPLLLMGDFNFPPNSAPYDLLSTGSLSYERLVKPTLTVGEGPSFGKMIIPPSLGITDNCQHIDCVESNYKCAKTRIRTMKRPAGGADDEKPAEITDSNAFSTGTVTHSFKLRSIFNHIENLEDFGSTRHFEWITVDHFFFSDGEGPNSSLQLMKCYELPNTAQCASIPPLPNADLSSDHFLLAAEFNLVLEENSGEVDCS